MLPTELLLSIVQHLPADGNSRADLRSLRAAAPIFSALITPKLFSILYVTNSESSAKALLNVLDDIPLRGYVREIVYEDREVHHDSRMNLTTPGGSHVLSDPIVDEEAQQRVMPILDAAFRNVHLAPSLTALTLTFFPHSYEDSTFAEGRLSASPITQLYCTILAALASSPTPPTQTLRSLTLMNLRPVIVPELGSASFKQLLTGLSALHLHICDSPFVPEVIWTFWRSGVRDILLAVPQANLAALALHCNRHSYMYFTGFSLERLHFPRLQRLSMKNMYFSSPFLRLEDFVLRHGATLEGLELESCSLLMHPATAGHPPRRTWAEIYDGFAIRLEKLDELDIRHGTQIVDPVGHDAALRTLMAIVDSRRLAITSLQGLNRCS